MPPPKKAAKKAAKSAAKKAPKKGPKHHHDKHHGQKDLLRAFEHLGRVQVLQQSLPSSSRIVDTLATLAQQQLKNGEHKDAADLLRAAEHLMFAALVGEHSRGAKLSPDLQSAIEEQFDDLAQRSDEHWNDAKVHPATLGAIYLSARKGAEEAYRGGEFHKALEYMRGAEALSHVENLGPQELDAGEGASAKLSRTSQ